MRRRVLAWACAATAMLLPVGARSAGPAAQIVAAENFYGDIAGQIAGPGIIVDSILSNPDEDPHLYESSPSAARAVTAARIVVFNGAGYDPWMERLLRAHSGTARQVIEVATLLQAPAGANPHLWYDPKAAPATARALAAALEADDSGGKTGYERRLQDFLASLAPIDMKIAAMRRRLSGTPVTATEPVFGYMASAVGLKMRNQRFQLAVMNDTEPSAADVAAFERDLRQRKVRVLVYNSQATDTAARRLLDIAKQSHVPVVGVTETEPPGKTYQQWMLGQLEELDRALSGPPPA